MGNVRNVSSIYARKLEGTLGDACFGGWVVLKLQFMVGGATSRSHVPLWVSNVTSRFYVLTSFPHFLGRCEHDKISLTSFFRVITSKSLSNSKASFHHKIIAPHSQESSLRINPLLSSIDISFSPMPSANAPSSVLSVSQLISTVNVKYTFGPFHMRT